MPALGEGLRNCLIQSSTPNTQNFLNAPVKPDETRSFFGAWMSAEELGTFSVLVAARCVEVFEMARIYGFTVRRDLLRPKMT